MYSCVLQESSSSSIVLPSNLDLKNYNHKKMFISEKPPQQYHILFLISTVHSNTLLEYQDYLELFERII